MVIPVGPEPTPHYVWAPPQATSRIRRTCTTAGVTLLVAAAVLGVAMVVLAFRLPTADHAFAVPMVLMAALAAVFLAICGFGAVGARSYVSEQHLNIAGIRVLRTLLLLFAIATTFVAALAILLLVGMADGLPAAVAGYLLLPAACAVLAIVGAVVVRRELRPPPAGYPQSPPPPMRPGAG